MSIRPRLRFLFSAVVLLLLTFPALADNVTISGTVTFASLDGSSLDHDHTVNGVFTVNDGNLTVLGTINCNDTASADACPMQFNISGNVTLAPGSQLFAENRSAGGNGANITFNVGGNVLLQGSTASQAGALISTGHLNGGNTFHGGDVTFVTGGTFTQEAGSVVSTAGSDCPAGAISITSGGAGSIGGYLFAGPGRTVSSNIYTSDILSGGGGHVVAGPITIKALTSAEPGLSITSTAIVANQGGDSGPANGNPIVLEACNVQVNGLVASLARRNPGSAVIIRSGTTITVDGSNLGGSGIHLGMLRADATRDDAATYHVDLYANEDITVVGAPTSSTLFAVKSNPGPSNDRSGGTINVTSLSGGLVSSGNAFQVSGTSNGDKGGTVNLASKLNVAMTSTIDASGAGTNSGRAGGHINVRSYSGSVSWTTGVGDVRPVGSSAGVPAGQQGTIALTYCTTLTTAGTSFPTNGSPVGVFPTTTQTCSPAAPTLPAGNTLPTCNTPPVANNDTYTVAEGGTLNVAAPGVLGNDTDAENNPLTATLVSGPAHASSFTFNSNGSFTYVHDGSETTTDSFTYKANDGSADSNVATVTITITPVNDAPVANDDSATVAEGGTINFAAPGVLANDTDPDGPALTAVLVSGPAHASAFSLNADGSYVYVHDGSETTSDSFTYKASDGSLFSNVATVHITITPVNDAPVANNDSYTVAEGGTLNIAAPGVLGNDTDPDSPTLHTVLVSGPAHASSFTLNANGSFTYVHDGSETISDSFTYKANDGSLDSNVATVNITVTPVDDAPVANNDAYSVNEGGTLTVAAPGVLGNDTDVDSPSLSAILVSGPAHASSFALNPDGSFSYVHDGSETTTDSFTYKANDGTLDSNVATVTITINPVNDAPVAVNDSYSVNEGGTLSISAPGVLGNDSDPDSPVITAVLVSGPAHASSFTLNPDGSFSYVHDGSETTSDSFTYKANDGSLDSNVATVTITVNPVNDAPVANNDAYTVNEGGTLSITAPGVLGNDTDVDSPSLTAVLVSSPAHAASFSLNADGSFTYVHDGSETTTDTFTYKANDGSLDSNVATVTITVTPVNDAPVITAGATLNYTEGDPASMIDNTITITDSDSANLAGATVKISANYVSGQDILAFTNTANITGVFNGATGTLTLTGSDTVANYQAALRTVTYSNTSNNPSTTPRTVSWQVDDGAGVNNLSNVATSTINVTSVNSAPVLANGSTITYTENDAATPVNTLITVSDVDSPNLTGATVTISGNYVSGQDVLSFTNALGITGSFNAGTGTLTLSGSATVANYQTALRSVKYSNTSDDPSTAARTITFQVDDGGASNNLSNIISSTVNVTAVNDPPTAFAYSGLPAQAGIPITYPAGKLGGTDVEAGTTVTVDTTPINLVNVAAVTLNANGSFTFTPTPASAGGTASFQYRVSDNGNPAPGVNGSYVTVSFNVAGPAIYFTKSAPVGTGNCTLGNECTVAGAVTVIGGASNASIFISDANAQSAGPITLNSGGSIIGQGVTAASFDALYGIGVPAQGTLAPRPLVNQARPTLSSNITLNNNSQTRGFNLSVSSGEGLIATSRTGLVVSEMDITSTTNNSIQAAVHFTTSSGTFSFGNITVGGGNAGAGVNFTGTTSASTATFGNVSTSSGQAVSVSSSGSTNFTFGNVSSTIGQAVGITTGTGAFTFNSISASGGITPVVVNAACSFTVNGTGGSGLCDPTHTGGTDCSGGTITGAAGNGMKFTGGATAVVLNKMHVFNNASGAAAACATNLISSDNSGCLANLFLQNVSGVSLDKVLVTGSKQQGINGLSVNNFSLTNSNVNGNGTGGFSADGGVTIQNLSGTVTANNDSFTDNNAREFYVANIGAQSMTFNTSTSSYGRTVNGGANAGQGLLFDLYGSSSTTFTGNTLTFSNNQGLVTANALQFNFGSGSSASMSGSSVSNSTFDTQAAGLVITSGSSGAIRMDATGNIFTHSAVQAVIYGMLGGVSASGTLSGIIQNNTIGTAATLGCLTSATNCHAIDINAGSNWSGQIHVRVDNNSIQQVAQGVVLTADGTPSGTVPQVHARITRNTITNSSLPSSGEAIRFNAATTSTNANLSLCYDVGGAGLQNVITGDWATGSSQASLFLRQRFSGNSSVQLPGFAGVASSDADVTTYLNGRNSITPGPTVGQVSVLVTHTSGQAPFVAGSCVTP